MPRKDGRFLLVLLLIGIHVSGGCVLEDLAKEVKELKQILVKDVGALTKKVDGLSEQNELQQKLLKNISECACSDKPPPTVEEACKQAAADIVFALDASGSIGSSNFQKVLDFVQDIVKMLDINGVSDVSSGSRVGLVTFSSTTSLQFQLNKYNRKDQLLRAIARTKYTGGETNIGAAISYARAVMFQSKNGDRATVPNYLVLLTDAKTSARDSTLKEAARARQQGIKIVAVGIGSKVDLKDLEALSSPPSKSNAFFAASFSTLADDVRNSLAKSICEKKQNGNNRKPESKPQDCAAVLASGSKTSGVYTVYLGSAKTPVQVYCDMTTDGGGWLVFQRRKDGSQNFYLNWASYAKGFGSLAGEFWLGNENLHLMTSAKDYQLRVDLVDYYGNRRYAKYADFKVGSSSDKYKLSSLGTYSGNAGDSLTYHAGKKFTTFDQDNDLYGSNCATTNLGAWWYGSCYHSSLNGKYYRFRTTTSKGIKWSRFSGYSLKFTEMKIRPK